VTAVSTPAAQRRRVEFGRLARGGLPVWLVVLALVVGLTIDNPAGFWSPANIAGILTGTVVLGLVSLGQHLVALSGGIDLSVGSMATLSCLLTALLIDAYPIRTVPVLLAMLVLGALVGVIHGMLVTRAGLAPFVVTLSTFYLLQGIAFLISTTPVGRVTTQLSSLGLTQWGPIPEAFLVLVVAVIAVFVLVRMTVWGRHLYAAGGDPDAARSAGVPVGRTVVFAYVAGGILAAAAGIMLAAQATVGSPTAGQGLELSAITVVVVGGVSLLGGRGSLAGTLGGIALLALLESSFTLLQLPATWTDLVRGVVILAAVAIFVARPRR
jgi:ribose transport system permease protein